MTTIDYAAESLSDLLGIIRHAPHGECVHATIEVQRRVAALETRVEQLRQAGRDLDADLKKSVETCDGVRLAVQAVDDFIVAGNALTYHYHQRKFLALRSGVPAYEAAGDDLVSLGEELLRVAAAREAANGTA